MKPGPVLIVEDDAAIRSMLIEVLEDEGYRTVAATNGADAIAAVDIGQPRLVVLDLDLPIVDGGSVARELRERGHNVPILIVSARSNVWQVADEVGAIGYCPKPFNLDDLICSIAAITNLTPSYVQDGRYNPVA